MRSKLCSCRTFCNSCWDGVRTTVPAAAVLLNPFRARSSLFCTGCNPRYLTALVTIVEPDQNCYQSPRAAYRCVHVGPIIDAMHRIIPLDIPCILLRIQVLNEQNGGEWDLLSSTMRTKGDLLMVSACTPQKSSHFNNLWYTFHQLWLQVQKWRWRVCEKHKGNLWVDTCWLGSVWL